MKYGQKVQNIKTNASKLSMIILIVISVIQLKIIIKSLRKDSNVIKQIISSFFSLV